MTTQIGMECDHRKWELAFRAAIGDILGNVERWTDWRGTQRDVLQAGLHYDRPWTRDSAINGWNGLSVLLPDVAKNTLLSALADTEDGIRIGGQYWDSVIWIMGAWNHYLVTGDEPFLAEAHDIGTRTVDYLTATEFDPDDGLYRGPGCFLDGISAYPMRYRDPDDWNCGIENWHKRYPNRRHPNGMGFPGKALSTNCLYVEAIDRKSLFRRHGHQPAGTGLNERFHDGHVAESGW